MADGSLSHNYLQLLSNVNLKLRQVANGMVDKVDSVLALQLKWHLSRHKARSRDQSRERIKKDPYSVFITVQQRDKEEHG